MFVALRSGAPICPLTRRRQVGSYYILEPDDDFIQMYDMDSDDWKTFTRGEIGKKALNKRGDGEEEKRTERTEPASPEAGATDKKDKALRQLYNEQIAGKREYDYATQREAAIGAISNTFGANAPAIQKLYNDNQGQRAGDKRPGRGGEQGNVVPGKPRYLIVRPWAQYEMSSVIYAKAGAELGQTFHGHAEYVPLCVALRCLLWRGALRR